MGLFRDRKVETRAVEVVERRDPTAATKSLRWLSVGRPQAPDWDASRAYAVAYYMEPIVYRCVQVIAEIIASKPFRVGPDPTARSKFNPEAPLARMLGAEPPGGPAPGLGASELWAGAIRDYLVTGRFGWEIETPPGSDTPVALWPLAAPALVPIPSASGTQWFSAFDYGRSGGLRRLPPDRVFYCWRPHGTDFRQPESALQAAGLAVSVSVMQSREDYAFLANGSKPATLVITQAFAEEDEYRAFKQQWGSEFGGPANSGRTAFLETDGADSTAGAVDVKVLGATARDAQSAQRSEARQREIAIALGVPFGRLKLEGVTYANAEQEDRIFWQQTLLPLIRRLQNAVNVQLAPRLGPEFGWFDLSDVKALSDRIDPVTAQVGAPAMVQSQLMWINEARADYGLPPVPNGDRFMSADEIAALKTAAGPTDVARALEAFEARITSRFEVREAQPGPPAAEPPAPEPVIIDHEARRTKLWNTTSGRVVNLERRWERRLREMFDRQAKSTVARLEGKRGRSIAGRGEHRALGDEVFDRAHWTAETDKTVTGLFSDVVAEGGARVSEIFGLAFDLEAPYAQEFIRARASQLAGQLTETTYEAIKATLAEGVGAGEGIPELAERLRHVFDVASQSRATTIARTEVISAFNGSASLVASTYGADVVAGKEWIAARDNRTRDEHVGRDGEISGIDEPFSGGLMYPGDPGGAAADVINCRCTVGFLTPDDMPTRVGRSRVVDLRIARAVLALVRPGMTEHDVRQALRQAA